LKAEECFCPKKRYFRKLFRKLEPIFILEKVLAHFLSQNFDVVYLSSLACDWSAAIFPGIFFCAGVKKAECRRFS
jgi:hypothetical protein